MLDQREYCMVVRVHYRVHLPVAETLAVSFGRTFVDASAVGDVGCLGRAMPPGMPVVLQFMRHVLGQFPRLVGIYVVVDGLLAYTYAFLAQYAGYLPGRPVSLYHAVNASPQFVRLAVVAREAVSAFIALACAYFHT